MTLLILSPFPLYQWVSALKKVRNFGDRSLYTFGPFGKATSTNCSLRPVTLEESKKQNENKMMSLLAETSLASA